MKEWVSIAIEEYKTLREESLTSLNRQQQIFSIGAATIGVFLLAGINAWDKSPLPEIIFLVMIPIIVYLVFLIWFGEFIRMIRAGKFLRGIENKIDKEYPAKKPLTWENYLAEQGLKNRIKIQYIAIFALFILISGASIGIGNYKIWKEQWVQWSKYIYLYVNVFEYVFFILFITVLYFWYRKTLCKS
ncbi:MAG: hypothetical protein M1438_19735 [Deltaproteobacteria bacterium]|nr:hypothetical protein [Deltaproteobacteria bacterium]